MGTTARTKRLCFASASLVVASATCYWWEARGKEWYDVLSCLVSTLRNHPKGSSTAAEEALLAWTRSTQGSRMAVARGKAGSWILERSTASDSPNKVAFQALKELMSDEKTAKILLSLPGTIPKLLRVASEEGRYGPMASLLASVSYVPFPEEAKREDVSIAVNMSIQEETPWSLWSIAGWCEASEANARMVKECGAAAGLIKAASGSDADAQWMASRAILSMSTRLSKDATSSDDGFSVGFVSPLLKIVSDATERKDAALASASTDALRACLSPSSRRRESIEETIRNGGLPLLHLVATTFEADAKVQASVSKMIQLFAKAGMPREEAETWMPTLLEWRNEKQSDALESWTASGLALAELGCVEEWFGTRRGTQEKRVEKLREASEKCSVDRKERIEALASGATRMCSNALSDASNARVANLRKRRDTGRIPSKSFLRSMNKREKEGRVSKAPLDARSDATGSERRDDSLGVQRQVARLLAVLSSDPSLRPTLREEVRDSTAGISLERWLLGSVDSQDLELASHASKALLHLSPETRDDERYDDDVHLLTPIHTQVEKDGKDLDIVFVHGLRGGAYNTWRTDRTASQETSRESCWPWSMLSGDMPNARMLSVDYATALSDWGGGYSRPLAEIAQDLLEKLVAAGIGRRPVVFVAHSMGGLVVKDMLARAARSEQDDVRPIKGLPAVARSTRGVVFFSVPHYGSWIADWAGGGPTRVLRPALAVQDLKTTSPYLESINQWLWNKCKRGEIEVLSLIEGKATPLLEVWPQAGVTVKASVVPIESAFPGYGRFVVLHAKDHMNICKPSIREDASYQELLKFLRDLQLLQK